MIYNMSPIIAITDRNLSLLWLQRLYRICRTYSCFLISFFRKKCKNTYKLIVINIIMLNNICKKPSTFFFSESLMCTKLPCTIFLIMENFSQKCWIVTDIVLWIVLVFIKISTVLILYCWFPILCLNWLMEYLEPISKDTNYTRRLFYFLLTFYLYLFELSCLEICPLPFF